MVKTAHLKSGSRGRRCVTVCAVAAWALACTYIGAAYAAYSSIIVFGKGSLRAIALQQPITAPTAARSSPLDPAGQDSARASPPPLQPRGHPHQAHPAHHQQQDAPSLPREQRRRPVPAMIAPGLIRPPPEIPSCLNVLGNTTSIAQLPSSIKSILLKACSIMGHQAAAEAALGLGHQPGLIPKGAEEVLAALVRASAASASACRLDVSVLRALSKQPHTGRKVGATRLPCCGNAQPAAAAGRIGAGTPRCGDAPAGPKRRADELPPRAGRC
jgi:hypothetical protein